jgi:ribosomal protein S12 methylthiotransferase accessory factor
MRVFDADHRQRKQYRDGTHRSRAPGATVRDFARLMPRMGITRLSNITGLDAIGLPVYMAIRPNSRSLSAAQGKGFDRDSARASALMEAIESWHCERIERPIRHDSYRSLRRGDSVIDVTRLPRRADKILRLDTPLLWVEGWDLLSERRTWVPFATVTTNFVHDPDADSPFVTSSNGLASGNHLLEAIVHATCELIERDATTLAGLATATERDGRRVDLDTVDDPYCRLAIDLVRAADVEVIAYETTTDIGIPAFECKIFDRPDVPRWHIKGFSGGFGCHPCPAVALLRAITEAIQSRLTLIAGSRDDAFSATYESMGDPALLREQLERLRASPPRRPFRGSSLATDTFEDDLTLLLERLRAAGVCSVVAVDLTRDDVGVPVVKVVATHLEGYNKGSYYAPGERAVARGATVSEASS